MSPSASKSLVYLAIFHFILLIFALSDLKRFIFHVHISRVDRAPVQVDIDSSSSLWYPILVGIIFNLLIVACSLVNLHSLIWEERATRSLTWSAGVLLVLFVSRLVINVVVTRNRNGLATPTLVEQSFFAVSLSLEEELTTIAMDSSIKLLGILGTLRFCYQQKQERMMSVERRHESRLLSNFE